MLPSPLSAHGLTAESRSFPTLSLLPLSSYQPTPIPRPYQSRITRMRHSHSSWPPAFAQSNSGSPPAFASLPFLSPVTFSPNSSTATLPDTHHNSINPCTKWCTASRVLPLVNPPESSNSTSATAPLYTTMYGLHTHLKMSRGMRAGRYAASRNTTVASASATSCSAAGEVAPPPAAPAVWSVCHTECAGQMYGTNKENPAAIDICWASVAATGEAAWQAEVC